MDWVVGEVGWDGFIKWLYGPAGAGKSAIAQTIAEMCHDRHLLLASFFFSRTDPKRNSEKCLIATIAYQITVNAPVTRDAIEAAVDRDPAIFQRSIEAQLTALIIDPLTQLSKTGTFQSTPIPNLIIIDGLDECNDHRVQQHILHSISSAVRQPDVPLKFLICSRAEPHLTREFTSFTSKGMATRLSLEDGYEQNADIERYLRDSFQEIATTHRLKAYLPSAWPTNDVISTLVDKSSGQFIFAATAVKYISSDRHQPTRRLEIILGMQPSQNDRPFAELDALYMGILSFVEDVKATLRLLGVLILCNISPRTPEVVGAFMFLNPGEVERLLVDLASVLECLDMDTEIRMLHASFPDFLFDRSRSGKYYIDASMIHAELAHLCLSHIKVHESKGCVTCLGGSCCVNYALRCITGHLSEAGPSADLREALLNTCYITVLIEVVTPETLHSAISNLLVDYFFFLKSSKFTDMEDLYLHHRNIYDGIMRKRIANFPLDFGFIVGLVLAELPRPKCLEYFTDYFPAVEFGRIYQTLFFQPLDYYLDSDDYVMLLTEFLTDPGRAGKHALDSPKCALVVGYLLDFFIAPECSRYIFINRSTIHACSTFLFKTGVLLSKASDSDELVTRINHDYINCEFFILSESAWVSLRSKDYAMTSLRTFIKGVGDYLTRVVGSVPIGLNTTVKIRYKKSSESSSGSETLGPVYYEGQGKVPGVDLFKGQPGTGADSWVGQY